MLLAAAMPLVVTWLLATGTAGLMRLIFVLVAAGLWHLAFMLARAQPPSFSGALTALAIAVLAPLDLGLVPMLLGISFGVVAGELAFGGWGRNVVNPATVAVTFLGFGFPAAPWPDLPVQLSWSVAAVVVIGVVTGVMSGRIVAAAAVVLAAGFWGLALETPVVTAAAVTLVLLVCDPVASAGTALGRWLYGLLYGALVLLLTLGWGGVAPVQATVSAALLASLAAPLLDEIAISLWLARRKRLG
ncbi:RnfABCDGE type electron transport complex subunit D [Shinella sp. S4-D37]|uniref:RnfABCDGE type electron transport complex subunit D n=1 Tax=Shinella sp. S4-D37 TaxID=3161999 RepID=UPI0034674C3C